MKSAQPVVAFRIDHLDVEIHPDNQAMGVAAARPADPAGPFHPAVYRFSGGEFDMPWNEVAASTVLASTSR